MPVAVRHFKLPVPTTAPDSESEQRPLIVFLLGVPLPHVLNAQAEPEVGLAFDTGVHSGPAGPRNQLCGIASARQQCAATEPLVSVFESLCRAVWKTQLGLHQ
jgi:hypothetical protein